MGGNTAQYATNSYTFAEAVKSTGRKMQFVLFDNCYMANVEVAYDMKDATEVMIASPSEIIERGIPYNIIFKYLVGTPDYERFVNGFYDFYTSYTYPYGNLAAIDCSVVEEMADLMKNINENYQLDDTRLNYIQAMDGYLPNIFFDMADYVKNLCDDQLLLKKFDDTMSRFVLYAKSTDLVYSEISKTTYKIRDFSGITISDPSYNELAKMKTETSWYKSTH